MPKYLVLSESNGAKDIVTAKNAHEAAEQYDKTYAFSSCYAHDYIVIPCPKIYLFHFPPNKHQEPQK